jgi:hypothetical protein
MVGSTGCGSDHTNGLTANTDDGDNTVALVMVVEGVTAAEDGVEDEEDEEKDDECGDGVKVPDNDMRRAKGDGNTGGAAPLSTMSTDRLWQHKPTRINKNKPQSITHHHHHQQQTQFS